MNLQEIVDALAPAVCSDNHRVVGKSDQINLTYDEYAALEKVVAMLSLANVANYKQAQDAFPHLLNAVKLVLAIADHPDQNPTEKVALAPKTRAQLEKALRFAEK
jgi:hypothetical protein